MAKYKSPKLTVDIIIMDSKGKIVLIKRKKDPYKNFWALPGGFVEYGEKVEEAAIREAKEETGLNIKLKKLVGVYSDPNRDPRGHVVSICYLASPVSGKLKAKTDAKDVSLFNIEEIDNIKLAFDHAKMIKDALELLEHENLY
ncbi:NUDIX hydrolase [Methanothermus fervidus DSM 2088]|uniref:NUDIX hydrolase n=1 Tax=Methanothermus fervidus (strain ATCC 43054 / DSM 2088 / JCM 10308 / V24 S) TaxID=523846 RepID=E3GW47_METFV|nr:NUDIX hydrolase [Methanothermus fervidus]ADP77812.1 NUDIX hydrolase [Methanothermus fervidus DSM 2088]